MKRWILFSSSAALRVAAALATATLVVGCGDSEPETSIDDSTVKNVLITADTVEAVPAGESYTADLGAERVRYHFDFKESIDFERVTVVSTSGAEVSLSDGILQMQEDGSDPLLASDKRFSIVGDPSYFTELNEADLAELRDKGILEKVKSGAPQTNPQTVDECIEIVIYIEVVIVINGVPTTFWCEHVITVCD